MIYFAAPYFSDSEISHNEAIVAAIERKWKVFYPFRDGLRMIDLVNSGISPDEATSRVWECDFLAIRESRILVAVLDGRVPDEGVCVELGIARTMGKHVIGLVTDSRACFKWGMNPMVFGSLNAVAVETDSLLSEIEKALNLH